MKMKPEWKEEIPSKLSEWYGKDEYYLYVKLLMNAGLRPSESAALTWGDISQEPIDINGEMYGTINVTKIRVKTMDGIKYTLPKFDSDIRTVLVPWQVIEEICLLKNKKKDDERIFQTDPYRDGYARRWVRVKKELSLPTEMKWFNLRKYYIDFLVRSDLGRADVLKQIRCMDSISLPDLFFDDYRQYVFKTYHV